MMLLVVVPQDFVRKVWRPPFYDMFSTEMMRMTHLWAVALRGLPQTPLQLLRRSKTPTPHPKPSPSLTLPYLFPVPHS